MTKYEEKKPQTHPLYAAQIYAAFIAGIKIAT